MPISFSVDVELMNINAVTLGPAQKQFIFMGVEAPARQGARNASNRLFD